MMCFKPVKWALGAALISSLMTVAAWANSPKPPLVQAHPEWIVVTLVDPDADCTTAIRQAYNEGFNVFLPKGTYRISGPINTADPAKLTQRKGTIRGAGIGLTTILQTNLNSEIIHNTDHLSLTDLTLKYHGTPAPGAIAINSGGFVDVTDPNHVNHGSSSRFTNLHIENAHVGIEITGFPSDALLLNNINVDNCISSNLYIHDGGGVLVNNFNFINPSNGFNGDPKSGTLGAVRFVNQVEGVCLTNGHIFGGNYSMMTDGIGFGRGKCPFANKLSTVYFDSAQHGTLLNKCLNMEFVNCWFSGGRGGPSHGLELKQTKGLRFSGGEVVDCGAAGINVNAQTEDLILDGMAIQCNSVKYLGQNRKPGINIEAGTGKFAIVNCLVNNSLATGSWQQDPGIKVESGASDQYIISRNRLEGNLTRGMIDGGTGANKVVKDNLGYTSHYAGSTAISQGKQVVVNHNLDGVPPVELVRVWPRGNWSGQACPPWVSDINESTFTVNCNVAVKGPTRFNWSASLAGEERY